MERLCTTCGMALRGRSDKKFCDDQCRSSYNNVARNANNEIINRVNRILKKNRQILEKLNPSGKIKIRYTELVQSGFDMEYHTHSFKTLKGNHYFFCYDYGYLTLAADSVLLVKNDKL